MNKLMARIVAVVLAVMMLGTVSFAATDVEATATENAINAEGFNAEQGMYTVKAKNADGEFIAMYQGTTAPTSIAINPEKVAVGETITVEYGGVDGAYASYPVVVTGEDLDNKAIEVAKEYTDKNGTVYSNVAVAKNEFTPVAATKKIGYKLVASGGSTTGATVDIGKEVTLTSSGGTFTYELIIVGVPADVTITATPYVLY